MSIFDEFHTICRLIFCIPPSSFLTGWDIFFVLGLLDALEAHFCDRLGNLATDSEDSFYRLSSAKTLQRKMSSFDSKLRGKLIVHVREGLERFQEDATLPVLPRTEV